MIPTPRERFPTLGLLLALSLCTCKPRSAVDPSETKAPYHPVKREFWDRVGGMFLDPPRYRVEEDIQYIIEQFPQFKSTPEDLPFRDRLPQIQSEVLELLAEAESNALASESNPLHHGSKLSDFINEALFEIHELLYGAPPPRRRSRAEALTLTEEYFRKRPHLAVGPTSERHRQFVVQRYLDEFATETTQRTHQGNFDSEKATALLERLEKRLDSVLPRKKTAWDPTSISKFVYLASGSPKGRLFAIYRDLLSSNIREAVSHAFIDSLMLTTQSNGAAAENLRLLSADLSAILLNPNEKTRSMARGMVIGNDSRQLLNLLLIHWRMKKEDNPSGLPSSKLHDLIHRLESDILQPVQTALPISQMSDGTQVASNVIASDESTHFKVNVSHRTRYLHLSREDQDAKVVHLEQVKTNDFYETARPLRTNNRNLALPFFHGHEASFVEVRDTSNNELVQGTDYEVRHNPARANYVLHFLKTAPIAVHIEAHFKPGTAAAPKVERELLEQLANLPLDRLEAQIQRARETGFVWLAERLATVMEMRHKSGQPFTIFDLEDAVAGVSRYSTQKEGTPMTDPKDLWEEYAHFLNEQGVFCAQCDGGNLLGAKLANKLLAGTGFSVRNRSGYMVKPGVELVQGTMRHLQSDLLLPESVHLLDFTPRLGGERGWRAIPWRRLPRILWERWKSLWRKPNQQPEPTVVSLERSQATAEEKSRVSEEQTKEIEIDGLRDFQVEFDRASKMVQRSLDQRGLKGWPQKGEVGSRIMQFKLAYQSAARGDWNKAGTILQRHGYEPASSAISDVLNALKSQEGELRSRLQMMNQSQYSASLYASPTVYNPLLSILDRSKGEILRFEQWISTPCEVYEAELARKAG